MKLRICKYNFNINIILTILLLTISISATSQISYETSKALLIYQFAKNINHKNDKNLKKYKICFLGDDITTFQELDNVIATNNKIKGKPVELSIINNLDEISDIQLLYVDKTWATKIKQVAYKIENKNILLVSEKCFDAKYIMINILYNQTEKKVSFEVNKANLILEDFTINPELLLTGGKEIDIRELYREMKQELEKEKKEIDRYKQVIKEQTNELANLRKQTDSLSANINSLLKKISRNEGKLNYLLDSVRLQKIILKSKLIQIKEQEIKLQKNKDEIKQKEKQANYWNDELNKKIRERDKQQKIINKHKNIIDEQKNILSNQEITINTKNKQLIFSLTIAILFIVVAIFILYVLKLKQKANKKQININTKLATQKAVIEKTLQQLKDTQNQLVHSEKMASLGVLTAGIAHEINNPINYINSSLEGLRTVSSQMINIISDNKKESEELNYLINGFEKLTKNIQTGVIRATNIIKSLSAFSRTDNDEFVLTDIHENINSTIILLYNQYKNKIEIIKKFDKIPKIYTYSSKLNQVFMNLLSNAIQAIDDKGTITITTSFIKKHKKDCIKISIKDTGEGIPKEVQSKIFEPFFTTKEVGKGTGVGLSITYGIIEQHKGRIEFTSTPDKGTNFEIYLPVVKNIE